VCCARLLPGLAGKNLTIFYNSLHKRFAQVPEDGAQAFGAEIQGSKVGSLAEVGCTSFFPAKPLGCYGDGGMCFTQDDVLAELMRSISLHGQGQHKYENIRMGVNGRMETLQAAILPAKFKIFPEEVELRQAVARTYTDLISSGPFLVAPYIPDGYKSAWAQYSVLAKNETHRSLLQSQLEKADIPTAVYYPKPLHLQPAFRLLGYEIGDFPISEDYAKRVFSLPMHPHLNQKELQNVVSHLVNHGE
jgi:UDP-2-acetamido-2-deoxy-ribo-hexuluronate aminotransferase